MHGYLSLTALAASLGVSSVLASPAPATTPAPRLEDAVAKRADSCTFSGSSGYSAASQSKAACSTIVLQDLTVPGGETLNLENLNDGTKVIFEGTTKWGYAQWAGSLFSVSGRNITVKGNPGSVLDGQGALWWDTLGGNGGVTKPKFFKANNLTASVLDSITILNAPRNSFSINYVDGLVLRDITIDNRAGDKAGAKGKRLGHNTDAFDVNNARDVVITGARVWNQDDCVAVNSGENVRFENGYCHGSHGLSIGSVGGRANNVVRNITFANTVLDQSQQAVRIKTFANKTGTVSDITYRNITINGADSYGIIVTQSYGDKGHHPTSGVPITRFNLEDVRGTVDSKAVPVYIECGKGGCSDWTWTGVSLKGGNKSSSCVNVPAGVSC